MRRMSKLRTFAAIAVLIALLSTQLIGWGDDGHRMINRVAAEHEPQSMPQFFRGAVAQLEYLGPEPDRWRETSEAALKNSQEPDHFIDLERVEGMELPNKRYDFYRMLYEKRAQAKDHADDLLPEKVGLQPYITMEVYERLIVAFREYRTLQQMHHSTAQAEQDAIFYAGWLGHYVGDGANPMHTTIQYNGWVGDNPDGFTTRKTVHSDFESTFVHNNIKEEDFASLVHEPQALSDPWKQYNQYLRDSNALVRPLYTLDKTNAFTEKGTPEGKQFVEKRLAAGAQMLTDLWYTAWLESAKPVERPERRPNPAAAQQNNPAGPTAGQSSTKPQTPPQTVPK